MVGIFVPIRIEFKMEQLSPEVQQKVVKMNDGRLRQKLVQAGYCDVDVATLDRASLLEYYAKVVLAETAYIPAKEKQDEDEGEDGCGDSEGEAAFAESKAGVHHTADGDLSVEERRLTVEDRKILLEERRLEEQRLLREQQKMQLEEQRLQREQQQEQIRMQLEE